MTDRGGPLLNVYGWLHPGKVLATLSEQHRASLEKSGSMVGDEIVTLLLLNTGNIFHRVLKFDQVVIVPIDVFYIWKAKYDKDSCKEYATPWKSSTNFTGHHVIAFPIHIRSPLHFTLGMMVNLNWQKGSQKDWVLFHFDSYPCSSASRLLALEFGKHLVSLSTKTKVKEIEVPVIHQPYGSNDCGFYPSHFLDIILQDIDHCIGECLKMADEKLTHDSPRVKAFWKYHSARNLRQKALSTLNFYMKLVHAIEEDKEQGLWST